MDIIFLCSPPQRGLTLRRLHPVWAAAGHGENKTMEVLEDSPCTIPYNYLSTSDTLKLTAFDSPPEQT